MKPPFWEVTISRQVAAGDTPIIESVNCFADKNRAEEFGNQARHENPLSSVTVLHVEMARTDKTVVHHDLWIAPASSKTKARGRSVLA
jgi:hypothetical protein